ncbi:HD-GYP domain-containing protein [Fimbriiglobus ruber]|nr:HD-GYP domain-containing protein [Fimbriiglobus ruber]
MAIFGSSVPSKDGLDLLLLGLPRDPLATVEGLIQSLASASGNQQSIQATVQAVCEGVGADAAFWFSRSTEKVSAMTGSRTLTPAWCGRFARAALAHSPTDREVVLLTTPAANSAQEPANGTAAEPQPHAALLCRNDQTSGYIVAVTFRTDKKFDEADAKIARVAYKMLLTQRSQIQNGVKQLLLGLVHSLTAVIDAKDPYTAGHSERVARIAALLAKKLGLSPALQGDVFLAGLIHDLGKIGVRDEVLHKPGKLTAEEYEEIKQHPVLSDRIVASIKPFDRLRPAVRGHHERYDGTGYPDRLAGEAIPLLARVLAVADSCDAMMSPRRYRPGLSPIQIDLVFTREVGRQFDPDIVAAFMAVRAQIYPPIYQQGIGESAYHAIDHIVNNLTDGSMMKLPAMKDAE